MSTLGIMYVIFMCFMSYLHVPVTYAENVRISINDELGDESKVAFNER